MNSNNNRAPKKPGFIVKILNMILANTIPIAKHKNQNLIVLELTRMDLWQCLHDFSNQYRDGKINTSWNLIAVFLQ